MLTDILYWLKINTSKTNTVRNTTMKYAYDANDMTAAVQYANKTKEQYARGNKEIAFAMAKRDPNFKQGISFEEFQEAMFKIYKI